jgi:hypothetical protein
MFDYWCMINGVVAGSELAYRRRIGVSRSPDVWGRRCRMRLEGLPMPSGKAPRIGAPLIAPPWQPR